MARITKVKKDGLDLPEIFSPGYQTDTNGKIVTGYKWKTFVPTLNQGTHTQFQLTDSVLVVNSVPFVFLYVNGIQVDASKLTLSQSDTLVTYNSSDFSIDQDDIVEIKYVIA
tara:strand:- start:1553 stop:1888 length:336 start_codon:yes stop_codon:yes gene_type:complete